MKTFRLTMIQKGTDKRFSIYVEAENDQDARAEYEKNWNRFNSLVSVASTRRIANA